jgi:Tfp pilus assembly protein PilV
MSQAHGHASHAAAAFSLIEILISVLILALGLLGLGALFPVVLREQRIGTENIQGVLVTNNTKALLAQMDLNALLPTVGPPTRDVWGNWRWRLANGTAALDNNAYQFGEWFVADVDADGAAEFGDPGSNAAVRVPLSARLHPSAGADRDSPQFVWDVAVHRVSDFVAGNSSITDPLQAVIFVRKIDPRIRVAPDRTLRQVLLGDGIPAGERRLPLGRQNGTTFLPTLDGTDGSGGLRYSTPLTAERGTHFDITPGDGRYINNVDRGRNDGIGALMAQPNQKLVDNLGNIYTVEAIEQDPASTTRSRLRINPPISPQLTETTPLTRPRVVSFVFTAQIPAGVAVMEVLP